MFMSRELVKEGGAYALFSHMSPDLNIEAWTILYDISIKLPLLALCIGEKVKLYMCTRYHVNEPRVILHICCSTIIDIRLLQFIMSYIKKNP